MIWILKNFQVKNNAIRNLPENGSSMIGVHSVFCQTLGWVVQGVHEHYRLVM